MRNKTKRHNPYYFPPRILAIIFILFISLFALDVFREPGWFVGLLIHLIPSFVLLALTVFSWKNEKIGGLAFILAGVFAAFFFRTAIISIPTIVIGSLFLLSYKANK